MVFRAACIASAIAVTGLSAPAAASPRVAAYIAAAVADPARPVDDRKLDPDRKPAQLLAFAQVHPGEAIAEYLPGGGYYTRMLSGIVGAKGRVFALETTTWGKDNIESTRSAITASNLGNVALDLAPLGEFHLSAKVDLFWITDNYHDLHVPKYANVDMAVFNSHVFNSLKPGGAYLIIDHAAAPGTGATLSPSLHRIDKATVIAEVTAVGFKLARQSDLLHNPADDHSRTVFEPAIHFKTDQFVLLFRKP